MLTLRPNGTQTLDMPKQDAMVTNENVPLGGVQRVVLPPTPSGSYKFAIIPGRGRLVIESVLSDAGLWVDGSMTQYFEPSEGITEITGIETAWLLSSNGRR